MKKLVWIPKTEDTLDIYSLTDVNVEMVSSKEEIDNLDNDSYFIEYDAICSEGDIIYYQKNGIIIGDSKIEEYQEMCLRGERPEYTVDQYVVQNTFELACGKGDINIVKWLIKMDVNITDDIMMNATISGNLELLQILHFYGGNIKIRDKLLIEAIRFKNYEIVKWLTKIKSNI